MDNQEEMDRHLEKISLPKLNQEEIEIMNNPVTNTDIETVIKNLPRARWLHRRILSNIQRKANAYFSETLPKNCRGRNTSTQSLINVIFPSPIISSHQKYDLKRHSKSRRQMPWIMAVRVVSISCISTRPLSFLWPVL